jgi:hypothetical protein
MGSPLAFLASHLMRFIPVLRFVAVAALCSAAAGAYATSVQSVSDAVPANGGGVDGPFFPRAHSGVAAPTTGVTLQRQAQQRLVSSLGAEGALQNGAAVTKAQAQTEGLGYVAAHFDQIDTARSGTVTMKDVQQYLKQQK